MLAYDTNTKTFGHQYKLCTLMKKNDPVNSARNSTTS